MKITGVGGVFCASHSPNGVQTHGHTWVVMAWFYMDGDAETLQEKVKAILKTLDHTHLPDHIAWGEDIAEYIGLMLPGCFRVTVDRPHEYISAEWTLD